MITEYNSRNKRNRNLTFNDLDFFENRTELWGWLQVNFCTLTLINLHNAHKYESNTVTQFGRNQGRHSECLFD